MKNKVLNITLGLLIAGTIVAIAGTNCNMLPATAVYGTCPNCLEIAPQL